jgi:hypothetical protein
MHRVTLLLPGVPWRTRRPRRQGTESRTACGAGQNGGFVARRGLRAKRTQQWHETPFKRSPVT